MNKYARHLILIFFWIFSYSHNTFGSTKLITSEHLNIYLDHKLGRHSKSHDPKKISQSWKRACRTIGNSLMINHGPYGYGAFTSFSCYFNSQKIDGKKQNSPWELHVIDGQKQVGLTLYYLTVPINRQDSEKNNKLPNKIKLNDSEIEAKVTFPSSEETLLFLNHQEFIDVVALMILDSMPMVTSVSLKNYKANKKLRFETGQILKKRWQLPLPSKELSLFYLHFDSITNSWTAAKITTAETTAGIERQPFLVTRNKIDKDQQSPQNQLKKPENNKRDKTIEFNEQAIKYETVEELGNIDKKRIIWAHHAAGRGAMYDELNQILQIAAKDLIEHRDVNLILDSITATIGAGLVGMRYGVTLGRGDDPLIDKFTNFALLVEVRGGPLEGLRVYWDLSPQVKETLSTGEELRYRSSRLVLGWAFNFEIDSIVDQADIVPKLGEWTFDGVLPVEVQSGTQKVTKLFSYKLDNAPSAGYEFGLEKLMQPVLFRGWFAQDIALGILSSVGKGSVNSSRAGLDAYIDGPNFTELFDWTFLLFTYYEYIKINNGENTDTFAVNGFQYRQGFAGGGVSLSW